ncbi:hypothetical protein [Mucilaginibacter lacusdianchii]|uniref:hypothetical protein n=1 Tax=Mucilaginibacter lacusdianchii TaxID=2684211 RepID=UPI00131BBF4F|nr:hypothetical protein [Mucilaginibacter sp. JXJ CY 39]
MFRKIISKRDPHSTIGGELLKELAPQFKKIGCRCRLIAERYPRLLFSVMIISMLSSGILAFTIMRSGKPENQLTKYSTGERTSPGLGSIVNTAQALQMMWAYQSQVNILLKKDTLTSADSLVLQRAFENIELVKKQVHAQRINAP